MKKKVILLGAALVAFLMLMNPSISAVKQKENIDINKTIEEISKEMDTLPGGIWSNFFLQLFIMLLTDNPLVWFISFISSILPFGQTS